MFSMQEILSGKLRKLLLNTYAMLHIYMSVQLVSTRWERGTEGRKRLSSPPGATVCPEVEKGRSCREEKGPGGAKYIGREGGGGAKDEAVYLQHKQVQ